MKKIYFTVPDIIGTRYAFAPLIDDIKRICLEKGFECLLPYNENITNADDVYEDNILLLNKADIVLANLNPFRGTEPDSGTVWECSYASAKGIPVVGYMEDELSVKQRVFNYYERPNNDPMTDLSVEDFGYRLNLMLTKSLSFICTGTWVEALNYVSSNISILDQSNSKLLAQESQGKTFKLDLNLVKEFEKLEKGTGVKTEVLIKRALTKFVEPLIGMRKQLDSELKGILRN